MSRSLSKGTKGLKGSQETKGSKRPAVTAGPVGAEGTGAVDGAGELLRRYRLAHSVAGRFRLRPVSGGAALPPSPAVLALLRQAFPGAEPLVSLRSGSILVRYAAGASRPLSGGVADLRNPLPGKVLSLFYPAALRAVLSLGRALPYLAKAARMLLQGRLNMEALDGAALAVCLLRRDFKTLSSLTFFFALGAYLAAWTRGKSRLSLEKSLAPHLDYIWVHAEGGEKRIPYAELRVGDEMVVRTGEVIPADGVVLAGQGLVNQASMTGEPLPVFRGPGGGVYAGTALEEGELTVKALKVGGESRIQAIIRAIEDSEKLKAEVQGRYERMADAIAPGNFLLAGLTYVLSRDAARAGSVFLVDYSCALRLAAPLAIFAAMREAADRGILIKGGIFMEAIANAEAFVFDKTGTLTRARPVLAEVIPFGGRDSDQLLRLAACLEEHFAHPMGRAVTSASDQRGLRHEEEHARVTLVAAHGIASSWQGKELRLGSAHFVLEDGGISPTLEQRAAIDKAASRGASILYLSMDKELAGILLIEDSLREEAAEVLRGLRAGGAKRLVMLTGDGPGAASAVAAGTGISEFQYGLLPEDKETFIRNLQAEGWSVAMVGDGINDSPALAAADVGIALGEGAYIARETADIVLSRGELEDLPAAVKISRAALRRIRTGFKASLFWNSVFLLGGLSGLLTPGLSALLHNAATAAIALSSLRPFLAEHSSPDQNRR